MSVRTELNTRVKTLATTLNLPVSYENTVFAKPANNGTFLEMFIVPAVTVDVTVDGTRHRELGYMQINLWIKAGIGTVQEAAILAAIKTAFPLVPKTGTVSIEATPTIKPAIIDASGGYRIVPVVVQYRCEQSTT